MVKYFGIGNHAGSLCVSEVVDVYEHAVRAGLDYVVATDEELVDHIRTTVAQAEHPLHTLGVAFCGLAGVFPQSRIATAAARQPLPRPKLYPRNINPKAVHLWDNMFLNDRYAQAISFKTPLQVWAIANRYFRDLCNNAGVHPYRDEDNFDFDLRDFVALRVRLVKSRLEQIYRHLDAAQVAYKQSTWTWSKFESDKKDFYITASKKISVRPGSSRKTDLDRVLRELEGYNGEHIHYSVTDDSAIYLDYKPKARMIVAEMHIQIPRGLVLRTLRLTQTKTPDEEKRAISLLEALVKAWSHGELKAVVASVTVPKLSGAAYVSDVLNTWLKTEAAATAAASPFHAFYTKLLDSMQPHQRLYFCSAMQADPSLMDQLHRFNQVTRNSNIVTAAATKQLRTLTDMKVYKRGVDDLDPDELEKSVVDIPAHAVLLPRKEDEDEVDEDGKTAPAMYQVILHPEKLHGIHVALSPAQLKQCADIENDTETFEGSIAAAFEMLVERFDSLALLRSDAQQVQKSLGYTDTWPYAENKVWLHHLNMKSTHPGLTFDIVDVGGRKHLAAIYAGLW
jgi:hypothetical protein